MGGSFLPTYYKKLAGYREDLHQTRMHEQVETALLHPQALGADPTTISSLMIGNLPAKIYYRWCDFSAILPRKL